METREVEQFRNDGYVIVRGLFSTEEAAFYRDHFTRLREAGSYPLDDVGINVSPADPLARYPRMIHMHRWDKVALDWLIHPRLNDCLTQLLGREPFAVQTMLYFKPPGSRGQALHQDNMYLQARPGDCAAAWMALDACDEENGCLQVAPRTQDLPMLCQEAADASLSFTGVQVPLAEGMEAVPMVMSEGDVLFFSGSVIHGSLPNTTEDRFRRALIAHYVTGDSTRVARFYHPALRMDGSVVALGESEGGGPCGVWTEESGRRELALVSPASPALIPDHE